MAPLPRPLLAPLLLVLLRRPSRLRLRCRVMLLAARLLLGLLLPALGQTLMLGGPKPRQ
jgi:hypothetical protein